MIFHQAIQIYSTLGMTSIDDLVNNIFSVFDRSTKNETILQSSNNIVVSGLKLVIKFIPDL